MCGRFAITLPHDAMAQLFSAAPANDLPDVPNFNVCPTNQVYVISAGTLTGKLAGNAGRRLSGMRWGFVPKWYRKLNDGPLLINARGETLAEKPAFRVACRERRCLIPVSGFYEWLKDAEGVRWPWYIHAEGPLALAGVWQSWSVDGDQIETCAIVTTAANDRISKIHHRMPVVIDAANWGLWLGEEGKGAARLITSADNDLLSLYQVDRKVNSNRASGAALIEKL